VSSLSLLVALIPALYLSLVAIPLTVIDLKEHRLPNRLVLPVFPIALLAQGIAVALGTDWTHQLIAIALSLGIFVIGVFLNYKDWLGMGDVKLIAGMALVLAFFNPYSPGLTILVAFLVAFLVISVRIMLGKASFGQSMPLGPYLLGSFLLAVGQTVFTQLA
jgi:leader peptidase (prepilin peptidase) / N-methyltransferase